MVIRGRCSCRPTSSQRSQTTRADLNAATVASFDFIKAAGLRNLLVSACALASGQAKPRREKRSGQPIKQAHGLDWVNFHTFCHTYATWMRRYAGLDTKGLVGTGRWRSEQSASRYAHVVPSEDARAASGLPDQKAHLALTAGSDGMDCDVPTFSPESGYVQCILRMSALCQQPTSEPWALLHSLVLRRSENRGRVCERV